MDRYLKAYVHMVRDDAEITVYGRNIPSPIMDFHEGNFPSCITRAIRNLQFAKPTAIQSQVWPAALSRRDVVGIAQTGSGKTLSYILPAIVHIYNKSIRAYGPIALVLAPTRELARQIQEVCQIFTQTMDIQSVCVLGGKSKEDQLEKLDRADICIATPGRLIEVLEKQEFSLRHLTTYVVLDEADRMLDLGFEPQIRYILQQLRPDHQTLMFSATWPADVQQMAEDFLQDYIQINIGTLKLYANHNITQIVDVVEECEKDDKLIKLIREIKNKCENKTIIFAETKNRVDELTDFLRSNGYTAMGIHGKKTQKERDCVMSEFRKGYFPILVATDVAARGLDIDDISYVINVDFPNHSEDYIHRIGRTARLNKTGTAYTFFTFENMRHAKFLVDVLEEAKQTVNPKLLSVLDMSDSFTFINFGRGRKWEEHFENGRHHPYKKDKDKKKHGHSGESSHYGSRNNDYKGGDNNSSWNYWNYIEL